MPDYPKSPGAIWERKGQKGPWLSIAIEIDGIKHNFVAFPNKNKKSTNSPDYWIEISKPKNDSF